MRIKVVCLAVLVAVACRSEQKIAAPVLVPATEAEAQKFVEAYLDALQKPNAQRAAQLIDWEALLERATKTDAVQDENWRRNFIIGANRSEASVAASIIKTLEGGGRIEPLRIRSVDGERRALLRLILPDGSFNYHEMPLVRDASGFVRARDVYIYASGEYLSDTIRRLYITAVATDPSMIERLKGKKNVMLTAAPQAKELMAKVREGDGKGALAIYRSMPAEIRKDKAVMLGYVMAASKVDDQAYQRALEELRAAYPNDRGMELMFIDAHLMAGRYDEAMQSVDRIEEAVDGDPYLDTLRAGIRLTAGDLGKAEEFAVRACERAPQMEDAWWARVSVALAQNDFAETARLLGHLRDGLGVTVDDLTKYPDYAEFVESAEYRKFRR